MSKGGATDFLAPKPSKPEAAEDGAGTDAVAEDDDSVLTAWLSCHTAFLDRLMLVVKRKTLTTTRRMFHIRA